jgi:hypothetical protein
VPTSNAYVASFQSKLRRNGEMGTITCLNPKRKGSSSSCFEAVYISGTEKNCVSMACQYVMLCPLSLRSISFYAVTRQSCQHGSITCPIAWFFTSPIAVNEMNIRVPVGARLYHLLKCLDIPACLILFPVDLHIPHWFLLRQTSDI